MTFLDRYHPADLTDWQGRETDPTLPQQYWFQAIQSWNLLEQTRLPDTSERTIALLSYACEEGVRRNQGRLGAVAGPQAIRKMLAKHAFHFLTPTVLYDAGAIHCEDGDLEKTQQGFGAGVKQLLDQGAFPVLLGGGHDIAYATHLGLRRYLDEKASGKTLGIINLDAHFDLRMPSNGPNSGTPFYQIAEDAQRQGNRVPYMVLGIQPAANPYPLFETATQLGVEVLTMADLWRKDGKMWPRIDAFLDKVDLIHLSIDLDGFSLAYAPGVSAPSPMGMSVRLSLLLLHHIWRSGKVMALEIAEMNPTYDQDGATARLAARLIGELLRMEKRTG